MNSRLAAVGAKLDAPLLITNLTNILYLTGFESSNAALLVQPDGKLIVSATYSAFPDKEEFLAIRATAAGELDPDFGAGGIVQIDLAPPPDGV